MKAGALAAGIATLIAAAATIDVRNPFLSVMHDWRFALAVTAVGSFLLATGVWTATRGGGSRFAAAAALGGALLAGAIAYSAFLAGDAARLGAAPGQTYRPPHAAGIAVIFPDVTRSSSSGITWPDAVTVVDASRKTSVRAGGFVRAGAYVFSVASSPIAFVEARTPRGQPVTVTQPDAPAFLSPFLTFPALDGDKPEDYFAVPALHRTVQVDYWNGLPSRGVDIPFLALRISEENGGTLFEGVAVSGRRLVKAGLSLEFTLGVYPVVMAGTAPPLPVYWAGVAFVAAGWLGVVLEALAAGSRQKSTEHARR